MPDYDTVASRIFEKQRLEEERRNVQPEPAVKKKKKMPLYIGIAALFLCIGGLFGLKVYIDHQNNNSYDYQIDKAETAFSNREYQKAMQYVSRASTLQPHSEQALLLQAEICLKLEQTDEAVYLLQKLIQQNPNQSTAYGQLLRVYEELGDTKAIKELLDACESEAIKEKYRRYISEPPMFQINPGTYAQPKDIGLFTNDKNSSIYYTLDGSEPDENALRYDDSDKIRLDHEETVTIKAVAVNEKGIFSDVETAVYTIAFPVPQPPKISPSAGEFTASSGQKIVVIVPEGCTAYYAFDRKPTRADARYYTPVEMPEGTHTFYAILVSKYGKESYPGSAIYVVTKE